MRFYSPLVVTAGLVGGADGLGVATIGAIVAVTKALLDARGAPAGGAWGTGGTTAIVLMFVVVAAVFVVTIATGVVGSGTTSIELLAAAFLFFVLS